MAVSQQAMGVETTSLAAVITCLLFFFFDLSTLGTAKLSIPFFIRFSSATKPEREALSPSHFLFPLPRSLSPLWSLPSCLLAEGGCRWISDPITIALASSAYRPAPRPLVPSPSHAWFLACAPSLTLTSFEMMKATNARQPGRRCTALPFFFALRRPLST